MTYQETFSSGIEDRIQEIAEKTVTLFGESIITENKNKQIVNVDEYIVKMERWGYSSTIKVEVGIPKDDIIRWFLGLEFQCDRDEWVWTNKTRFVTTMESKNTERWYT